MNKTLLVYRELGSKRFRETFGLCYEDLEIGDVFEHVLEGRSRMSTVLGTRSQT
jgi:hypothetical protein